MEVGSDNCATNHASSNQIVVDYQLPTKSFLIHNSMVNWHMFFF